MQIDGTYAFVYSGADGMGFGVFTVKGGQVQGCDFVGAKYNGTAMVQPDGSIEGDIVMQVPAGVTLVQGTAAQDLPYQRRIKHRFPAQFGDGEPVRVDTPPGQVIMMVKRVLDDFAPAATKGFHIQIPSQ